MKANYFISIFVFRVVTSLWISCEKEEDNDLNDDDVIEYFSGETEGTVTIDDSTYIVSGGSTESQYGFQLHPRNMTPPNSYPIVTISFAAKPTVDSTYTLADIQTIFSMRTTSDSNDKYFASDGSLVVEYNADSIVTTFSDIIVEAYSYLGKDPLSVSGTITYYQ